MTRHRLPAATPLPVLLGEENTRLLGPLLRAGVETVGDLLRLDTFQLAQVDGMGPAAAAEVRLALKRHGMSLKPVDALEAGRRVQLDPLAPEQARRAVQVTGGLPKRGEERPGAA